MGDVVVVGAVSAGCNQAGPLSLLLPHLLAYN
jgi:hypothetical protein